MEVKNLSELKKLIALLRKSGVETFKNSSFELKLGAKPTFAKSSRKASGSTDSVDETGNLSQEDILFWSSGVQS